MGLGDLTNKAKKFLNSEKGEKASDNLLNKASEAARKATGGKYDDKIEKARRTADKHIGNESAGGRVENDPLLPDARPDAPGAGNPPTDPRRTDGRPETGPPRP
ncbi:antitoxin [Saxibacter everestensis]|uniref:Antitoxin n=1 Tax=Saxibacter everestensis TaxID=2909229 RepID=A0ABY8QP88_9MICO|nr:antitoxin [Brevibacteriaceae bacterium ZFBP1038]